MKRYIALFIIIAAISGYAQPEKINDTLNVAAFQEFTIPTVGAKVIGNIISIDITGQLLDENLNVIRPSEDIIQVPSDEDLPKYIGRDGRGAVVWFVVNESIADVGTFYVHVNIDGRGEKGTSLNVDYYFLINVRYPILASPFKLKSNYVFSEQEFFSFATSEFNNPEKYSFNISRDGSIISSGNSSVVYLDSILNDRKNVGKTITIEGFYNGEPFMYADPITGEGKNSTWSFTISPPKVISEVHAWDPELDNPDPWIVYINNSFSKQFQYAYTQSTDKGLITLTPEIQNLRVSTDPPEFLDYADVQTSGIWSVVVIHPNDIFLSRIDECSFVPVTISIEFDTQFYEHKSYQYKAAIIY
jgi:hypothetical protein